MSPTERATDSILLKQRWSLIQSGTDRQSLRIRGSRLYCNSRLYGQVIDSKFVTHPLLSDYLPQPFNTSSDHVAQPLNTPDVEVCDPINSSFVVSANPTEASTKTASEDPSSK